MALQDEALEQMVTNAIRQDKRIGGQAIMVRATSGEIALKGLVDTLEQLELARLVTQGVPGVRRVSVDELSVRKDDEAQ